jgi:hypothetical protein
MKRAGLSALVAAALAAPGIACADNDAQRVQELERRLDQSMRLIEQLNRRIEALEKGAPAPAAPAAAPVASQATQAPAPATEARIEALEKNVAQMAGASSHGEHGGDTSAMGIPIHGFADVDYQRSTYPAVDARRNGFYLGNLDFFFTPNFGRVKMLAELNFEVSAEGDLDTDMERLQLGYTFSDAFTAWMGRFHTPYGYWNTAFHHGAQMQTVTRPRFVDFEDKGGVLPAHTVGIWGNGHVPAMGGRWQYDAYFGNGSRIVDGIIDFNAHLDDNHNTAVGGNVGYRFGGALDGLLLGAHALREEIDIYQGGDRTGRTRLAFAGGYGYLDRDSWEVIGEYYRFHNQDLEGGTGTHNSWAAFLQVGYTLYDVWAPYYRWEKAALDQTDPYFAAQISGRAYTRNVLGIKYALNPNTSLALEGNRTREVFGEAVNYNELRAQFAVRF